MGFIRWAWLAFENAISAPATSFVIVASSMNSLIITSASSTLRKSPARRNVSWVPATNRLDWVVNSRNLPSSQSYQEEVRCTLSFRVGGGGEFKLATAQCSG